MMLDENCRHFWMGECFWPRRKPPWEADLCPCERGLRGPRATRHAMQQRLTDYLGPLPAPGAAGPAAARHGRRLRALDAARRLQVRGLVGLLRGAGTG